jgi:subtilisin family serine protease
MHISEPLRAQRHNPPRCSIRSLRHPARTTPASRKALTPALHPRVALSLALLLIVPIAACAAQLPSPIAALVPHRYLIAYRTNSIPANIEANVRLAGAHILRIHQTFGIAVLDTSSSPDEAATLATLRAQPNVEFVLHDRIVSAHSLILRSVIPATVGIQAPSPTPIPTPTPAPAPAPYDTYYTTPQGWAVRQAGGYGANVPGGPSTGPWDTTMGAGIRIAILDSGVDQSHPDIAPNLAFNLSEIDQSPTGMPSPCDDASPQDQQGHGTWTASLAAGAIGPGTGLIIGVAPAAILLNIKVLERVPDPSSTAPDIATQCATGQASGLLSWIIQGIDDAIAQRAQVISLSLGMLVDLDTGEGAGLQALFNQVTFAAAQAGAVLIASAGNDAVNLANPRYVELPAQARDVLAVVASTNPACAEDLTQNATCAPGPITLPYYSNYGAPLDAIAAPGGSYPDGILPNPDTAVSGWIRGACSNGIPNTLSGPPGAPPTNPAYSFGCFSLGHTPYVEAIGTSASAPLVAGAAALLLAAHPTWTPPHVIAALQNSATPTQTLPAPQLNTPAAMKQL